MSRLFLCTLFLCTLFLGARALRNDAPEYTAPLDATLATREAEAEAEAEKAEVLRMLIAESDAKIARRRDVTVQSLPPRLPLTSVAPRTGYVRATTMSDAMASQGVNRRFWSPAKDESRSEPPPAADLEIEERGAFWFGSDGSSGHIRKGLGGRTTYER